MLLAGSGNSHADNPNYKTRLCERFETEQFCPYYGKCTFAHGAAELRQRPATAEQQDKPVSAVQASYQNRAKRTEPVEGEFHKTRLCERFMNDGECPFGTKCTYAHGREELRQRVGQQNNQNNQNNANGLYNNNNGQNRGYSRDGQNGERPYRSTGEGYQDRGGYRSQQQPQQQGSSTERSEDRPYRSVRSEGAYRSTFAENARENRDGPYRPPQVMEQEKTSTSSFRTQAEANPTGAYRPPGSRNLSSQANDDSLSRSVLAPRTSIVAPVAAVAAPATAAATAAQPVSAATTPVATSPATTPVLGSEKAANGRRRVQDLNVGRRIKFQCGMASIR